MARVTLEQAQEQLEELIAGLGPGEELEITQNDMPVAKLIRQAKRRQFGLGKGKMVIIQDDDE